jgi:macrolide transport system ATP-binding/permease protein
LAGVLLGCAGSFFAARLIKALLFDVPVNDYVSPMVSMALLFAVGMVAAALPSWRAARIDPLVALRHE